MFGDSRSWLLLCSVNNLVNIIGVILPGLDLRNIWCEKRRARLCIGFVTLHALTFGGILEFGVIIRKG